MLAKTEKSKSNVGKFHSESKIWYTVVPGTVAMACFIVRLYLRKSLLSRLDVLYVSVVANALFAPLVGRSTRASLLFPLLHSRTKSGF